MKTVIVMIGVAYVISRGEVVIGMVVKRVLDGGIKYCMEEEYCGS